MINTITFFYPTLMEIVLSVFICNRVDSASGDYAQFRRATAEYGYWYLDMYTPCFEGKHLWLTLTVGVLGSLLICIGLPMLIWLLMRHANKAKDSKSRQ